MTLLRPVSTAAGLFCVAGLLATGTGAAAQTDDHACRAAPGRLAPTAEPQEGSDALGGFRITREGERHVRWRENGRTVVVLADGRIDFSEDTRAVRRLGPGARLVIREADQQGSLRCVELRATGEEVGLTFYRDGRLSSFDTDARAWLQRVLPAVHDHLTQPPPERAPYGALRWGLS